jgi:hypothetical protein
LISFIPPVGEEEEGGKIRNIEEDFAAVITPGLTLAFSDRKKITLSGTTIKTETATRDIWVCGPGSFVVLKALAFRNRGENKDAYDLYYHIRNYHSFRLRQFTGVPLTRICEVACETAYNVLRENPELREEIIRKYSLRSPERQLELDLENGYDIHILEDSKDLMSKLIQRYRG